MKKVAVIILNWNGASMLKKFLPSVIEHTSSQIADIIIADNNSTDNSIEVLATLFPELKTIILSKNYGFAEGYNKSIDKINNEYVVLLNSDVEVTANWLSPIITYLDSHPKVSAVQPKIKAFHSKNMFEYAGAAGGFIDKYGFPFCKGRILNNFEKDNGQYNENTPIFWATGACMIIRTLDYKQIGGLDAYFFAHMEEIDLCWRLKARGKEIIYFAQSEIYHVGGGTLPSTSPRKLFLNYRNNLLLLYKNLPKNAVFSTFFIRAIFDLAAFAIFIIQGKIKYGWQIINAWTAFLKVKKQFISVRKSNLKNTTTYTHHEIYNKSIIFSYFIKNKKHFNELNF